jgi:hypothetical protein
VWLPNLGLGIGRRLGIAGWLARRQAKPARPHEYVPWRHSLRNEPNFPIVVWAYTRKLGGSKASR